MTEKEMLNSDWIIKPLDDKKWNEDKPIKLSNFTNDQIMHYINLWIKNPNRKKLTFDK